MRLCWFLLLLLAGPPAAVAEDGRLSLQVYGFSYHPDREGTRNAGLDNEFNPGLGLKYVVHDDARGSAFVEVGFYRDSGSNAAKLAGAGYQYKLGPRWRLGGALVALQSETYNRGNLFIAPLPIVSYDFGRVALNATYVPAYRDYNEFAVFGFYFSVPLAR
jgi:hypothetical protein